jgi:hypothetical protein
MTEETQNAVADTAVTQDATTQSQVQEATPVTETKVKAVQAKKSGDLILDVANEIENLTKTKALNMADRLAEDIEANYFKLGGVLQLVLKQQWFEGYPSFEAFVAEKFGFAVRKAHYLIAIYSALVEKQIPWEKVAHLGWTKLKDLAPILTLENLDEWVEKASKVTVTELQALIKASQGGTGDASAEKTSTTSDVIVVKFKLHSEQNELVGTALAKAKGELQTDHDNVALAAICSGYLANASGVQPAAGEPVDPEKLFAGMGFEQVLGVFEKVFPNIDLEVTVKPA